MFLTEILTQTQTNYLNFEIMTNELEKTIIKKLEATVQSYTALSLRPGIGNKTIQREGNRLLINEGRGGIFENVSEAFYDELVEIYDWRVNREKRFL